MLDLSPRVVGTVSSSTSMSSSSLSAFSTPSSNMFRYKVGVPPRSLAAQFEDGLPRFSYFHPRVPRKVPRSPYKVLDALALQDDFYLNHVDWSLHNVLAVGLGNCVYLRNACSSKATKLCDLGVDDSVCSIGWAQRGNHLVVGTNLGKVQVQSVLEVCIKQELKAIGEAVTISCLMKSANISSREEDKEDDLRDLVRHTTFEKGQSKWIWGVLHKVLDVRDLKVQDATTWRST